MGVLPVKALRATKAALSDALGALIDAAARVDVADAVSLSALHAAAAAARQARAEADGAEAGKAAPVETPAERQGRLDGIAAVVQQHVALVTHLGRSRQSVAASGHATPVPVGPFDFRSNVPPLLVHLVLSVVGARDVFALSCTSRAWRQRCKLFMALRHRTALVVELCHEERQHLHDLALLLDGYGRSIEKQGLCDMRLLVSNAPALRLGSRLLLLELETRLLHWSSGQLVGDVFLRLVPMFSLASYYNSNLDSSVKLLRWLAARPEARPLLAQVAARTGRDLGDLLLAPVHRMQRYQLFLEALLRVTPISHADVPGLCRARDQVHAIVEALGSSVLLAMGQSVLDTVRGLPAELAKNKPAVLRDGAVTVQGVGAARLFLCSQCLVVARRDDDAKECDFVRLFEWSPPPVVMGNAASSTAFDLHAADGSVHVLEVDSVQTRISWMQAIKSTIDAFLDKNPAYTKLYHELRSRLLGSAAASAASSKNAAAAAATAGSPLMSRAQPKSPRGGVASTAHGGGSPSSTPIVPSPVRRAPQSTPKRKASMTLSLRKGGLKAVRGLQKRYPVVDTLPDGTALYQYLSSGAVARLDVHPASLSVDGVFVLMHAGEVYFFRGAKVPTDGLDISQAVLLATKLMHDDKRPILMVDAHDRTIDEQWWALFGGKLKVADPTPKEVLERYAGARPLGWAIHPDKMMSEVPWTQVAEWLERPECILIIDALDDVVRGLLGLRPAWFFVTQGSAVFVDWTRCAFFQRRSGARQGRGSA